MTESTQQTKGYICRVSLVIEKDRISRVILEILKTMNKQSNYSCKLHF